MVNNIKFSFCVLMDQVHKNAKREQGQYPAILTELAWSIKDLWYGIPRFHVTLGFFYFCIRENHQHFFVFILDDALGFLVFMCYPDREITKTLLTLKENIPQKKTFVHWPAWTSAKFYCKSKTGTPEWAIPLTGLVI